MLQAIRTRAGGIIVKVLFAILIVAFGFWGIGSWLSDRDSPRTLSFAVFATAVLKSITVY